MPKSNKMQRTVLGVCEIRSDAQEDGIFEGYAVTWGSVDSYNTTFTKGCFKKTIQERVGKIKLLWNHDSQIMPIGTILELKEDEKGLYFRAKLAETEMGKEALALMKIGAINTMSFGFRTIKDSLRKDGVREISEVALYELSPVNFESNSTATIDEVRSTQFTESLNDIEMHEKGYTLKQALNTTMWDIWWLEASSDEERVALMSQAISDFNHEYIEWMKEYLGADERRSIAEMNNLSIAFNKALEGRSESDYAANSKLTLAEVRSLRQGQMVVGADTSSLPDAVRQAITEQETEAANALLDQVKALSTEQRSALFEEFGLNKEVETKESISNETRSKLQEAIKALKKCSDK